MKFTELALSLKEELFPVYVLEGEEIYFLEHALRSIRERCAIAQPALNDLREEGEGLKGEKLSAFCDKLYTLPFFDERRLIRLYGFHPTERDFSTFSAYLEKPCETTVLVIVNREKRANTVDFKKKKGVVYVDCGHADEETLTKWLFGLLRRMGLSADTDAVSRIVRYCAFDAARMKKEAEKLLLLFGAGGRVTREIVEEHIERDAEYKIYELTQASSRGDFTTFTEILEDLLKKGSDESQVLFALVSHYRQLLNLMQLKGLSEAEAAQRVGQKPYAVRKNRELIARLSEETVRMRYLALNLLSAEVRCGNLTKTGALMSAIAKIFFE